MRVEGGGVAGRDWAQSSALPARGRDVLEEGVVVHLLLLERLEVAAAGVGLPRAQAVEGLLLAGHTRPVLLVDVLDGVDARDALHEAAGQLQQRQHHREGPGVEEAAGGVAQVGDGDFAEDGGAEGEQLVVRLLAVAARLHLARRRQRRVAPVHEPVRQTHLEVVRKSNNIKPMHMCIVKAPKCLPIEKATSALKHKHDGLLSTVIVDSCVYIFKWRGLAVFHEDIIFGVDIFEAEVVLDKVIGFFQGTAEDNCQIFGVVLPENGIERVLDDVVWVVAVGRHNDAHRKLVFCSDEIDPFVGMGVRLTVFFSIVEAEVVLMIDDCLKYWVLFAKQALERYLVSMLLLKLSHRVQISLLSGIQ